MKKKLTKDSFNALKSQFTLLNENQQREFIGGGYFDDYGIGYYDPEGNYYWTRTQETHDFTFTGDSWDSISSSSSGQNPDKLFRYNPSSGYGTEGNPLSINDYNLLAQRGMWHGGYVDSLGFVSVYATSVEYGNSIYEGGSWYRYGGEYYPVSISDFYKLLDEGKWHGGYVKDWGYVSPSTTILGSSEPNNSNSNNDSFNINSAVSYLTKNALNSSAGACARYVRLALEAGGLSTDGRPLYATDYDTYLPSIGFSAIDTSNYAPQAGDIIVHEATGNHKYGHIAMYNGEQWISDFKQNDMYGGSAYRNSQNYTIFRWRH